MPKLSSLPATRDVPPQVVAQPATALTRLRTFGNQHGWLLFGLALFGLAALYINPLSETFISDDWSYALTVKHLVETGSYRVHEWSSSNLLFMAYWGALFVQVGGYSFASLHVSTLVLALAGLVAFYGLAREHGLDNTQAGLLTLCLISNPLVLYFSFTFMTDVPFLALLNISLLFYTRGLKRSSYGAMFIGGLAAFGAMYTRQTGYALVLGLGCLWLLNRDRLSQFWLYLAGLLVPVAGIISQLFVGVLPTSDAVDYNRTNQLAYMKNLAAYLGVVFLGRPTVFLQYLAFFSIPLVIVALIAPFRGGWRKVPRPWVLGLGALVLAAGVLYNLLIHEYGLLMPYLPWNLYYISNNPRLATFVTLLTFIGGVLYAPVLLGRLAGIRGWFRLPLAERLLDVVTFFLLGYHLAFFGLGDRYLFVLIPFSLIIIGRHFKAEIVRCRRAMVATSLIVLIVAAMWARTDISEAQAYWQGAEYARLNTNVPVQKIFGPWGWYSTYNFQDYLPERQNGDFFFKEWLPRKQREALIWVGPEGEELPAQYQWQVLKRIPYKDGLFQERTVLVVRRNL